MPLLGVLPHDPAISRLDAEGRPLIALDETSAIYPAVKAILEACSDGMLSPRWTKEETC